MKNLSVVTALLVLCIICFAAMPMQENEPDPSLSISSVDVQDSYVSVEFDITYPGFVELNLIDDTGEVIWIKGKICDDIDIYRFKIGRKPLEEGKKYEIILKYKGKDYKDSFYN